MYILVKKDFFGRFCYLLGVVRIYEKMYKNYDSFKLAYFLILSPKNEYSNGRNIP